MGVSTDEGGVNYESCADYLKLLELDTVHSKLREPLEQCMYGSKPVQPVFNIYHSALHDCWKISKGDSPPHASNLQSQCQPIYTGKDNLGALYPQKYPWMITPWDPEYICYGRWDEENPPVANNYDGQGYVGRCWADWPLSSSGVKCIQKECTADGTWKLINSSYFKNIENGVGHQCDGRRTWNTSVYRTVGGFKKGTCKDPKAEFKPIIVEEDDDTAICESSITANPTCYTDQKGCWGPGDWGPQEGLTAPNRLNGTTAEILTFLMS